MSVKRFEVGPRMSQAVTHGGVVYLAGQVADETAGRSVRDQAEQVLAKIDRLLALGGSDKSKVLQTTIRLTDMSTYGEFNEVWDGWIDPANPPARACIEAPLAHPDWKVELMLVAAA